jgi:hypothetical protein
VLSLVICCCWPFYRTESPLRYIPYMLITERKKAKTLRSRGMDWWGHRREIMSDLARSMEVLVGAHTRPTCWVISS